MSKRKRSGVLNRLSGKRLVFSGKFGYGVEESLKALAEAQQGTVCNDLDAKVDYLVLPDLGAGKTIQKKALSLNAKGTAIQVIDADGFKKLAEPTEEEILAVLRGGDTETYAKLHNPTYHFLARQAAKYVFSAEDFSRVALNDARLDDIRFDGCNFTGAQLHNAHLGAAPDCDFTNATGENACFGDAARCKFKNSALSHCQFAGDFSAADFTGATLDGASFADTTYYSYGGTRNAPQPDVRFGKAQLTAAKFLELHLKSPDFSGADLSKAQFRNCTIESGTFRNARLCGAMLVGCTLSECDLTGADLTGANLAGADLTGATLAGANFQSANLRGTKLDRTDLSNAKNYDPNGSVSGTIGPALSELDSVNAKAKRINISFRVRNSDNDDGEQVGVDSSGLKWGWGLRGPASASSLQIVPRGKSLAFSDAILELANVAAHLKVRFETVDVSSTKSPKGGKELRDLVLRGIAEAFAQEIPPEEELAEATKKYRAAEREKGAAVREQREQAKAAAAKQKEKANKQIAKKIEKAVGKVSDVGSFLKALEVRIEKPKIDKATKMLKASGFKLFNDVTDEHVSGVVKSQTDPDLVYACRMAHDGQYACCTQNLNICGGLRGSICKHLLVLIIGLVQAGELDPTTIDEWIAKTHSAKPELDKETMGAIFIKYKGAEAGEVDWRPTETVPEDYYTL